MNASTALFTALESSDEIREQRRVTTLHEAIEADEASRCPVCFRYPEEHNCPECGLKKCEHRAADCPEAAGPFVAGEDW